MEYRWKVMRTQCTDGVGYVVKTPDRLWEYVPFETEAKAQAYAIEMNELDARREEARLAEEALAIAQAKEATPTEAEAA